MNKGCLFSLIGAVLLVTVGLVYYFYQKQDDADQAIKTVQPVYSDIVKKAVATGTINPRREVQVKPQVSGVVDELFVEEGEIVKKGQKIARIKLVPTQVNINNAQSAVELARLNVRNAERELERQKGVFDQKLDIEEARVNFEDALEEEKRQKKLLDDGVISLQAYEDFRTSLAVAKAGLENAKVRSRNDLKQFETTLDIRRQEYQAAVDNLALLREGATQNSKQVANVINATLSGMILELPVKEGGSVIERNNFNEGTSIAVIADMNDLIFEGQVDESDVGKLKEGMPIELKVGAIDDKTFEAKLEFIAPKGIKEEGNVKFTVKAAVAPSEDVFLRAGYSANGDIILDKKDGVITLQERDIIYSNDSTFIEMKVGNEFQRTEVKTGLSDGINIEIVSAIDTSTQIKMQ